MQAIFAIQLCEKYQLVQLGNQTFLFQNYPDIAPKIY